MKLISYTRWLVPRYIHVYEVAFGFPFSICNILMSFAFLYFLSILFKYELSSQGRVEIVTWISWTWMCETKMKSWEWGVVKHLKNDQLWCSSCLIIALSWPGFLCLGFWTAASKIDLGYQLTHNKVMILLRWSKGMEFTLSTAYY